jgi:phosphoenolpyruvate phosphomutase
LQVKGSSILSSQIEQFNQVGIKDISVVRGFGKEFIKQPNINTIDNDIFDQTKELYSLFLAKNQIREHTIISYGDIIFKPYILNELLNDNNDITLIVDGDFEPEREHIDWVTTTKAYSRKMYDQPVVFKEMFSNNQNGIIHGEFIGLWKVNASGAKAVRTALEQLSKSKDFKKMTCTNLFNHLAKDHTIAVRYISGSWLDVDTIIDLQKAGSL